MKPAGKIKPALIIIVIFTAAWGIWKFRYEKIEKITIQANINSSAAGQFVTPEQRLRYANVSEKRFLEKGMDVKVEIIDTGFRTLAITGKLVNSSMMHQIVDDNNIVQELREMGFKYVVISNDCTSWYVNLKN